MSHQAQRWCFTVNNPGTFRPAWVPDQMSYMIYQLEKGEAGTPHLQGYIAFKGRKRLAQVKDYLCAAAHAEPAKGSEEQNKIYCSKDDDRLEGPWEFGEFQAGRGAQGKRSDLEALTASIKAGATMRQLAENHPRELIKYPTGVEKLHLLLQPAAPTSRDIRTAVLWGPTGVGKSHRVHSRGQQASTYLFTAGRDGWGGYTGQQQVLFEDFHWDQVTIHMMKLYLDKWPLNLDSRYFNKTAQWTRVWITSQHPPEMWWPAELAADRDAILRRLQLPMGRTLEITSQDQQVDLSFMDLQQQAPPDTNPAPRKRARPDGTIAVTSNPNLAAAAASSSAPAVNPDGTLVNPVPVDD
ncbi:MAG: putative viral replication protein [Cressdnaviricota sp.]|nr:MAG: putative viral replication protein [Cressdnaviricota sp.]